MLLPLRLLEYEIRMLGYAKALNVLDEVLVRYSARKWCTVG